MVNTNIYAPNDSNKYYLEQNISPFFGLGGNICKSNLLDVMNWLPMISSAGCLGRTIEKLNFS